MSTTRNNHQLNIRSWIIIFFLINAGLCVWFNLLGFIINPALSASNNLSWLSNFTLYIYNAVTAVLFSGILMGVPCCIILTLSYFIKPKNLLILLSSITAITLSILCIFDIFIYHWYKVNILEFLLILEDASQLTKYWKIIEAHWLLAGSISIIVILFEVVLSQVISNFFDKNKVWRKWLQWYGLVITSSAIITFTWFYCCLHYSGINKQKPNLHQRLQYFHMLNETTHQVPFLSKLFNLIFKQTITQRINQTNMFSSAFYPMKHNMHYPLHKISYSKSTVEKPNIVILMIDDLRFDMISEVVSPNIHQFSTSAIRFNHHYSGGNYNYSGLFSMIFSIPSTYEPSVMEHQINSTLLDSFQQQGYKISLFSSKNTEIPAFNSNKNNPINLYTFDDQLSADRDKSMTDAFNSTIQNNDNNPFFNILVFDEVQSWCGSSQNYNQDQNSYLKLCNRLSIDNNSDPSHYINRYKRAINYDDQLVGEVINQLKSNGLYDSTIVMITSNHGEEFNDNQSKVWGYGNSFNEYQLNVPLLIHWPGKDSQDINYQTSHYDIAPTLLENILHISNNPNDYSTGVSLFNKNQPSRILIDGDIIFGIKEASSTLVVYGANNFSYNNSSEPGFQKRISKTSLAFASNELNRFYSDVSH